MSSKINIYLVEYAINSLFRQKYKTIFITTILTILIFLLSSVFFITNSIKHELNTTLNSLPEIIVQKSKAGRHYDIDVDIAEDLLNITGVSSAIPRVWGYYYFYNAKTNFSIVGIDEYEEQYKDTLEKVAIILDFNKNSMLIGKGVKRIMSKNYYKEYFNFIKPDGSIKEMEISGVFSADTELESNDMIVMSIDNAREIFDMEPSLATDIVVKIPNIDEIATIAQKIKQQYPDTKVITKDDLKISYQNIFNYKSGLFLALFVISLFTFFIIIYDKLSGLSSEEKREVGVLKAIGWRVEDVLKAKFYEGFIVSFFAYLLGLLLSFAFVYIFQAPLLKNIFIGYSELKPAFELPFVLDIQTLALVFFLSVPIYIAATIIPSWRSATLEADEVIR